MQSKILRARERLEAELGGKVQRVKDEAEAREMPKVYKRR